MDRGDLVPDEVTVAMVRDRLAEDDALAGFLLDGFPRNVPQAETLKKILTELDIRLTVVMELVVDEEEVVRLLSGRRTCRRCERVWHLMYDAPALEGVCDDCGGELFQRDDDKEEVIRHRIEVYNSQTSPLIAFYADEGILVGIDATGPVEEVTSRAMAALGPYLAGGGPPGAPGAFKRAVFPRLRSSWSSGESRRQEAPKNRHGGGRGGRQPPGQEGSVVTGGVNRMRLRRTAASRSRLLSSSRGCARPGWWSPAP